MRLDVESADDKRVLAADVSARAEVSREALNKSVRAPLVEALSQNIEQNQLVANGFR